MMVNFKHQLDWTRKCPDKRFNTIVGISVRAFLDNSDIYDDKLNKADCLLNVDGYHSIHQQLE